MRGEVCRVYTGSLELEGDAGGAGFCVASVFGSRASVFLGGVAGDEVNLEPESLVVEGPVGGFLGKDGVELEFKKEETPILRVGVDGIGKRSRRRGRKQERQHGAAALASASSSRAGPAGQPEEDTTSVPEGDLCGSCRREALLRRRADVCALQMECDELAVMAAAGCPVKHLKDHQLRLAQQLRVLDGLLAELKAESCLRCGLCLDAACA